MDGSCRGGKPDDRTETSHGVLAYGNQDPWKSPRGEHPMARRAGFIWIGTLVVVSLAIGVFLTIRTAPPSPMPWWWGKDPDFHVEVWEPGKEMATVAMTMPK